MSQSGKVLHVLVEVRSVPEREGKGARDVEAVYSATPLQEEVQMEFGLIHGSAVPGTDMPLGGYHAVSCRGGGRSFSPSKSHSTSFQHCPVGDLDDSSSTLHRQSLPSGGISQLLSAVLNPTANGESTVMSHSSERETSQRQSPWSSPATSRGPSVGGSEGQRSVVTFSYIEKASVRTVESPRNAPCRTALDCCTESPHLRRFTEGSAHPCKRMNAPVYFYSPESSCHSSLALSFRAPGAQQVDPICFIARASTHRELEELGSPQLKRRAADGPAGWHHQQPRCQSWAGSPIPAQGASSFPNTRQGDPDWLKPPCDLPRNSTKNQRSTRTTCQSTSATMPTFRTNRSQEAQNPVQWQGGDGGPGDGPCLARRVSLPPGCSLSNVGRGLNQLSGTKATSAANSPQTAHRLAKEATRLSTTSLEVRGSPSSMSQGNALGPSSPRQGCLPQEWQQCPPSHGVSPSCLTTMNIPVSFGPGPDASIVPGSGKTHTFPVCDTNLAEEVPSGSPAHPARLNRCTLYPAELASPLRDPRLQTVVLNVTDTPTLHRHQVPQYKGENWSPDSEYERGPRDSPEPVVRLFVGQRGGIPDTEAPVSWTSRQQWGTASDSPKANQWAERCLGCIPPVVLQKEAELWTREPLLLGPVTLDSPQVGRGRDSPALGCWNVLSNAEREPQPDECCPNCRGDRGSTSSETTLSSHRSYETGHATSGIQSDSGLSSMGSSLRSQKIARAKWEFLFGTPSADSTSAGSKGNPDASTAPPSGTSSESPTPTPPTSLPLEGQRSASHHVQQVELELVTPPPMEAGASPKTGIIRRTIKYSETDLDAVPLRCYRETDMDEVLADQDEADSAFGSNRSVPGTPGTSGTGSSPLGGAPYERTDGEEEDEEEDREVDVVSWASARRQWDRKRNRGISDEGELFSLLLKRPLDGFLHCHPALKSPILVSGPRPTSEDTFSRHFESIMESHRAKGTSYCSLNSVDLLTSSGQSVFTFDLPTLTPEVQGQTYQSAREIVGLSFAPLARRETPSASEDTLAALDSDATRAPSSERLSSCSEDTPSWGWYSALSPRERPPRAAVDSDLDRDLSELLGLGSTDTLTNGSKADMEAAKRLAKRLFTRDGFRKSDVARQLSKNNDFSRMVAEEYLRFFNFAGQTLDRALRAFLREFALMGETQERERVLSHFSRRYSHCNPSSTLSEDNVHTLTCALMLLNTDLHGQNIGKRMSYLQFIGNLDGLNDGQDFPKELLKALYNSIKNEKLQWTIDEEALRKSFSELADGRADSASRNMKRVGSAGGPFTAVTSQSGTLVYKTGFLVRKVHADSDGKRTPRGKRGWKTFYGVLKGLILYLQKGEFRPEKQLSDEDLKNVVSIHHSLAMRAADYSKRPNVFYLRTADWRVYLFQAPNAEQMQSWITRINTVAAMFSAPPFPAAIGSQKKFSRPLLPGSTSKLPEEEQMQSHEARFRATSSELAELRSYPPDRKVKGRELEEYRQRDEYLEFEKTRYGTYAMLLRAKIRCGEEDLSVLESQILEDSGLQRAQSSPTLAQDSSQASSSKSSKRNEGQRHSYRQAVKK